MLVTYTQVLCEEGLGIFSTFSQLLATGHSLTKGGLAPTIKLNVNVPEAKSTNIRDLTAVFTKDGASLPTAAFSLPSKAHPNSSARREPGTVEWSHYILRGEALRMALK